MCKRFFACSNALNNLQLHSKTPATAKKTRNGFSQILPSKPQILPSTSKSTKVSNKYSMSRVIIHFYFPC